MRIKLKSTGYGSMERHYQRLIEAGWESVLYKETRVFKGFTPAWDTEETVYELDIAPETVFTLLFDLSEILMQELIIYKEDGQPVIEIYDDWRE